MPSKVNAAVGAGADIVREKVVREGCAVCGVRCAICVRCAVSSTNRPSSSSCDVARAVIVTDKPTSTWMSIDFKVDRSIKSIDIDVDVDVESIDVDGMAWH